MAYNKDKRIRFSIIIALAPDRNAEVLESLKKIDYPKENFEIIVERGLNPSDNRNLGFSKSKEEVVAFIDDDASVDTELLKNAEDFFIKNPKIDIVGGIQMTPESDFGFAKISGYALASKFGAWKISNRYSGKNLILDADETMLTSANLFCRKKVFEKIKFDPSLFPGEDPKFISDAKESGFKVAYNPQLKIYHKRRPSPKKMMKQIYKYGLARPAKEPFHETLYKRPFFLIPSLFIFYILTLIFYFLFRIIQIKQKSIGFNALDLIFFIPLILYFFLDILFSVYDSLKNKDFKAFFVLPFIYPMIHLSYGFGIIYGFIFHTGKTT